MPGYVFLFLLLGIFTLPAASTAWSGEKASLLLPYADTPTSSLWDRATDLTAPYRERAALERALLARGVEARTLLQKKLETGRPLERQVAARLLGRAGDPGDEALLLRAASDPHPLVREHAAHALALLYQKIPPEGRLERLEGDSSDSRAAALQALALSCLGARLGGVDPSSSLSKDWSAPSQAAGPKACPISREEALALLDRLQDADPLVKLAAAEACAACALCEAFRSLWDAASLAKLRNDLGGLLAGDPQARTRLSACSALNRMIPSERASFEGARKDPEAEVRYAALAALAKRGDSSALDALHRALEEADPSLRLQALAALSECANPFSEGPVAGLLADPSPRVRMEAAQALGGLPGPGITPGLHELLNDPDPRVRTEAAVALDRQGALGIARRVLPDLKRPEAPFRAEAARALGLLGAPEAVAPLAACARDADLDVACNAVEALGRISLTVDAAVESLLLALRDPRGAVSSEAALALGRKTGLPFDRDPAGALSAWRAKESGKFAVPAEVLGKKAGKK
ncbi:MAG: HEAT repeat domain-containing protein [Planctomycetota bacterium]